jgi:GTP cyclohydrolase II
MLELRVYSRGSSGGSSAAANSSTDAMALVARRSHGASARQAPAGAAAAAQLPPPGAVLLRVQDQCMTGEVFGSLRCDCKQQLDYSFEVLHRAASAAWRSGSGGGGGSSGSGSGARAVPAEGGAVGAGGDTAPAAAAGAADDPSGVVGLIVYLQQEGRGIGLAAKVAAYALQEGFGEGGAGAGAGAGSSGGGLDTVDANRALGLPDDCREYSAVQDILGDLGVREQPLYLLSNNPRKGEALGVPVARRLPCLVPPVSAAAALYLKAKAQRMGHDIPGEYWEALGGGGSSVEAAAPSS